jgi:hypothetical protein
MFGRISRDPRQAATIEARISAADIGAKFRHAFDGAVAAPGLRTVSNPVQHDAFR